MTFFSFLNSEEDSSELSRNFSLFVCQKLSQLVCLCARFYEIRIVRASSKEQLDLALQFRNDVFSKRGLFRENIEVETSEAKNERLAHCLLAFHRNKIIGTVSLFHVYKKPYCSAIFDIAEPESWDKTFEVVRMAVKAPKRIPKSVTFLSIMAGAAIATAESRKYKWLMHSHAHMIRNISKFMRDIDVVADKPRMTIHEKHDVEAHNNYRKWKREAIDGHICYILDMTKVDFIKVFKAYSPSLKEALLDSTMDYVSRQKRVNPLFRRAVRY